MNATADEKLTTIILPQQRGFHHNATPIDNKKGNSVELQLNHLDSTITTNQQKIRTLEKVLGEVVHTLSSSAGLSLSTDQAIPSQPPQNPNDEKIRRLILSIMTNSLEFWENGTGKSKIDLANESGIWSVQLDNGTYKTRTLNKYLKIKSIPMNPRVSSVINTAQFVLNQEALTESRKQLLESSVNQLKDLISET